MRRPWLVTTVVTLETLLALALIGTAVTLFVAAKNATPADTSDAIAAGILGGIGIVALVSCWGLWRSKRWAWGVATFIDLLGLITFLWDPITRRVTPDLDELAFILVFALLVILLVIVPVRRFFLQKEAPSVS